MRRCPICNHNGKRVIFNDYCGTSMVNLEVVKNVCLFECTECGHRYIDGLHLSQTWLDWYYLNRYKTDDKPFSHARLNSLAECVSKYIPLVYDRVLDIGGMDGELQKRMNDLYLNSDIAGIGDTDKRGYYAAIVLSHTLEHIYDVSAMFDRITSAIKPCGLLFVEVPVHLIYQDPKAYDYHWQHVNKFRPQDIERLCAQKGFTMEVSKQIEDYREYQVWRWVGRYG